MFWNKNLWYNLLMILVVIPFLLLLLAPVSSCSAEAPKEKEPDVYARLRREMVSSQIAARGIRDKRVLDAMLKVPRHEFVPALIRLHAYEDNPLPIGMEQTISQPYIVALMTEAVRPAPGNRALEIGTGSGYQAAVLAEIVKEVHTIEIIPELARSAAATLKRLGYKNVFVRAGDGFLGIPDKAPFDAIVVTCAAPEIPPPLIEQLAEGGRLVIPVGEDTPQKLILAEKKKGKIRRTFITGVLFVPMTGDNVDKIRKN